MRTFLACLGSTVATAAAAHEGHGAPPMHGHGGDLLWLLGVAVAIGVYLWRRGRP